MPHARVLLPLLVLLLLPAVPAPAADPVTPPIAGTLLKVEGKNLILRPMFGPHPLSRDGQPPEPDPVTVATDDATTVTLDGHRGATVADLQPGMEVNVDSTRPTPTRPAHLVVRARSKGLKGTIARIDGQTLVLSVPAPNGGPPAEVNVPTDDHTKVRFYALTLPDGTPIPPSNGTVADLTPGAHVTVIPDTGTARNISASPLARRRPPTTKPTSAP